MLHWPGMVAAEPAFTSLHVFGDGVCSTTNSTGAPYYYDNRWCNGRTWVEVLSQWQTLSFDITNDNCSFYGHYSPLLVNNVANHTPPPDVGTALYVIWVGNADFVWDVYNLKPYDSSNLTKWTTTNNVWLSNHFTAVTNLYAKGVRSLIMPNVVDLGKTPTEDWSGMTPSDRAFIRERVIEFNTALSSMISNLMASLPGLTIWSPDSFTLFDQVLADPANYGMVHPEVGALFDDSLADKSLNGPGAEYVFWDDMHPTARFQMYLADLVQRMLFPVRIGSIATSNGSNLLAAVNVPVGRDGVVQGSTNLVDWPDLQSFESINTTQTIDVPASGPMQFYRLQFTFNWSWP